MFPSVHVTCTDGNTVRQILMLNLTNNRLPRPESGPEFQGVFQILNQHTGNRRENHHLRCSSYSSWILVSSFFVQNQRNINQNQDSAEKKQWLCRLSNWSPLDVRTSHPPSVFGSDINSLCFLSFFTVPLSGLVGVGDWQESLPHRIKALESGSQCIGCHLHISLAHHHL